MAFQSLVGGGSECGPSNPLNSLLKHQNNDSSLHSSTFSSQGGPGPSLRSRQGTPGPAHQEADRFFQGGPGGGGNFGMDGLRRELEGVGRDGALKGDREWASQYHPAGAGLNPAEMAQMEEQFHQTRSSDLSAEYWRQQQQQSSAGPSFSAPPEAASAYQGQSGFAPSYGAYGGGGMGMGMGSMGMGMMGMGGGMGMMSGGMMGGGMMGGQQFGMPEQQAEEQMGKGKGRFVELDDADWEAQFARAGEAVTATPGATTVEAEQRDATTAPETINLLEGDAVIDASEDDAALMASLEKTWTNLQSTLNNSAVSDSEMAAWESQYGSQFADLNGDSGLGDDMNYSSDVNQARQWTKENVDAFLQNETPYPFATENIFLDHPDPYAEGQRLLAEGAPLSQAALAFEAACQIDQGRAEAWKAAGETWAADEREVKGIRALEKAVACGGPDGVGAWMSLAVAYVNEGQELRALATLERWLSLAYPSIQQPPVPTDSQNPWDTSNRVIDLFIGAARAGPAMRVAGQSTELAEVDPDVQVGLGVLFYSNNEYAKAKDCFEAALTVRPNDFLLWNRLGATLANGGESEEAISAYRRALDLRPTFTRATYNLGVSCLNIGCYNEAAEHLLAAIEGQRTRENPANEGDEDGSSNLWQTLRRSFLCMERHDLAEKSHPGTDLNEFRREGFEF